MIAVHGADRHSESLELARFLFAQAMEIWSDLSIVLDPDGRICHANPATERVLGWRPVEMLGRFLWDFLLDPDQIGRMVLCTLDQGQWEGKVHFRPRESPAIPFRLRAVLVQSRAGRTLGIVATGWDLTSQREAGGLSAPVGREPPLGEMSPPDSGLEAEGGVDPPGRARRRILVIEDDPGICEVLGIALRDFDLDVAENGESGLDAFAADRYDVVLLDYSLPGIGGAEVAAEIREQDSRVPVVLMTGWGTSDIAPAHLFKEVLAKPFSPQDLRDCLSRLMPAGGG